MLGPACATQSSRAACNSKIGTKQQGIPDQRLFPEKPSTWPAGLRMAQDIKCTSASQAQKPRSANGSRCESRETQAGRATEWPGQLSGNSRPFPLLRKVLVCVRAALRRRQGTAFLTPDFRLPRVWSRGLPRSSPSACGVRPCLACGETR